MNRPYPPELLRERQHDASFTPAPEVLDWIRATFLDEAGELFNRDHDHLGQAQIGALWTNAVNRRQMRQAAGTAEIPQAQGGPWLKARHDHQLRVWFGEKPDFLITLDAVIAAELPDANFCALVEHELLHCGQAIDEFGAPRFTRDGSPVWAIKGHDVEQFVAVVRRYGADAAGVRELVEAAAQAPLVSVASVNVACGTCGARAR